jgi:DNA repair exonuclease SbcCD ATPase subunit
VAVKGTKPQDVDPEALAQARADLTEQEKEVGLIEADLKAARTTQEVYDSYTQTHQALVNKIAKLKEAQTQAQDTAAIDDQITALDQRMKTGYELLDAVREFWRKKEVADAAAGKLAEADKEVALYDALAKALAPTGIPSELIREALGPVNERLALASGYLFPDINEHAPLHLSEDLEVYRGVTPFALLSKSARFRAGIAFQVTLAQLAGARIMMVDECDILDSQNRAALLDFIMAVQEDFDTVILLATSDHASPSPSPDLQVWVIIDGQVQPLNPGFIFQDGEVVRDEERKAA